MVLMTLTNEKGRHWFNIAIHAVYAATHKVEHVQPVGVYSDLLPSLRKNGAQVSFFTTSHSERILTLGGRGLLQHHEIHETEEGELELKLVEDAAQIFTDI